MRQEEKPSLLPENMSPLMRAIEEVTRKAFTIDTEISRLWTLEGESKVSDDFLPYLAWTLGVELWPRKGLVSDDEKRELVKTYIEIRKRRGTKRALELAYNAIGLSAEITERPNGTPHLIRIMFKSEQKPVTEELRSAVLRLTDLLKPVRVLYDIAVEFNLSGQMAMPSTVSIAPFLDFYTVREG